VIAPTREGPAEPTAPTISVPNRRRRILAFAAVAALMLALSFLAAILLGPAKIGAAGALRALTSNRAPAIDRLVVHESRLPRALAALTVGAALGVAGALMQGITRNPLASPGILGVNAGGGLALILVTLGWPALGSGATIAATLLGAALGATLAMGASLVGRGRGSPVRLVISGMVVSGLLTSLTGAIVLYAGMEQDMLYWTAGGLFDVRWSQLAVALPVAALGLVVAVGVSPRVSILALGSDAAAGLGVHPARTRAVASFAVLALAASSLSLAGPVAYVGLMVPHLARRFVGQDDRVVVPGSALLGGALVLAADLAGRFTSFLGADVPLGVYTAVAGAAFLIFLARAQRAHPAAS
jgi:iron complex transport system permease protein